MQVNQMVRNIQTLVGKAYTNYSRNIPSEIQLIQPFVPAWPASTFSAGDNLGGQG